MNRSMRLLTLLIISFLLYGCFFRAPVPVHIHDRHRLSYQLIAEAARRKSGGTLVLLDYHHDCGADSRAGAVGAAGGEFVASYNWVARLLEEGFVDRIVWVSGRTLLLPNRNSRMDWLSRSLSGLAPSASDYIRSRVVLADYHDLVNMSFRGPLYISLDLDVLTVDPGPSASAFLDELARWISARRPALLTIAFSTAYQRSSAQAWQHLAQAVTTLDPEPASGRYRWFLEAEGPAGEAETREEAAAWAKWAAAGPVYRPQSGPFYPGASLWVYAPPEVRAVLLERQFQGADEAGVAVLEGWRDPALAALEAAYPEERLSGMAGAARETAQRLWSAASRGETTAASAGEAWLSELPAALFTRDGTGEGLAVRLLNAGIDRGCLALYRGLSDPEAAVSYCTEGALFDPRYARVSAAEAEALDIEISVFGPWQAMTGPLDFRPGLDSLMLHGPEGDTLLQASLVRDRQYGREQFLATLSAKAGYGRDGWQDGQLRFSRAVTLVYRVPFSSQKNVKK